MIPRIAPSFRRALVGLVFFVLVYSGRLQGQSYEVSATSSHYVGDRDYDSLVRLRALPVARQNNISEPEMDARYDHQRDRFAEELRPLLASRYANLDRVYERAYLSPGDPGFKKARARYLREADEVVRTALKGTSLFSGLFSTDQNDRILAFHAEITVKRDGVLAVTENITIYNGAGGTESPVDDSSPLNDDIQRGIMRYFPTSYKGKSGFWSNTGFAVKAVFKNGEAEPYITEPAEYGTWVRIGRKDLLLPPGTYQYRIDYETNRQLIFHADKDELYWNVNGNEWVFTADRVSCEIRFPEGASIKEHACYTGLEGSTDRNCRVQVIDSAVIRFATTKRLESYEGLTIAVSIRKGVLMPPGKIADLLAFLEANYIIPVLALFVLVLFGFYYYAWSRHGRDPEEGVVYPRFSPPPELTPADVGYIMNQRYDSHLFAAALVDLAVKKDLVLEVEQKGIIFKSSVYHFRRPAVDTNRDINVTDSYGFSIDTLYGQTAEPGKYNSTLKACFDSLGEALHKRFLIRRGKTNSLYGLFTLNKGFTWLGALLVIAGVVLSIIFLSSHASKILLIITGALMLALITIHLVFVRIMSAYTKRGREIADHILGFKMYLEQAERRVFDQLTPPEKTLELFEKYLPFAIALEVENRWALQFDNVMQKAIEQGYQPGYYHVGNGGYRSFSMGTMSRDISSGLSGSISSASTPPSSSSGGSSGGGSSGGGGGGGGGGGW